PAATIALGPAQGDSTIGLPRRSLNHGELEGEVYQGHPLGTGQAGVTRVPGQHGEIATGADAEAGSSGIQFQHAKYDTIGSQVQAARSSSGGDQDAEQRMDIDQEHVLVHWQGNGDHSSHFSSTLDDTQPLSTQECSSAATQGVVERHCCSGHRCSRESSLVDRSPQGMERDFMGAVPITSGCLHGCFGCRMGDRHRSAHLERRLDRTRQITPYQLEGTPGGLFCSNVTSAAGQGGEPDLRQYSHHCIHQQIWGHKVTTTDGSGRQNMATLSGYGHETEDDI
ncbi:hypothetical protein BGZ99_003449, partial [Dissophora globulifera]